MNNQKILGYLIYFCKILLLATAVGWLIFSLMSGAENSGFLKNIPNSLPWIALLAFVLVAFRWQIVGGLLIILFGIFTIIFFSALEFIFILFTISSPLIILGFVLAVTGFFKLNKKI